MVAVSRELKIETAATIIPKMSKRHSSLKRMTEVKMESLALEMGMELRTRAMRDSMGEEIEKRLRWERESVI